jgi:hypothetical protein
VATVSCKFCLAFVWVFLRPPWRKKTKGAIMKKNKPSRIVLIIFSIILVSIVVLLSTIVSIPNDLSVKNINEYHLAWNQLLNKRQSTNACASYSSMALIFEKNNEFIDPEKINRDMPDRFNNGYTLPWGIPKYLKKYNINAKLYWFGLIDNDRKINWIRNRITSNDPVILLVGGKTYLHYITVLGFKNDDFYIYDSMLNDDKNGSIEGNDVLKKDELMKWWNNAQYAKIHLYAALSTR